MRTRRMLPRVPLATLAGFLAVGLLAAVTYAAPGGFQENRGSSGESDVNVCSHAVPRGTAFCHARVRTDDLARNSSARGPARHQATLGNGGAYDPAYLRAAYNAPSTTGGSGLTVAVVDAYDNPTAISDLNSYRSQFGLPLCTTVTSTGCTFTNGTWIKKVDQNGGTSYPRSSTSWAQESALDIDMVSALCPNCNILLVEGASNSYLDLGIAVNRAATMGAAAISNSYGGSEWSSETSYSGTYYNHPGIAVTVSSGDAGYGVEYPAASQYVTAVGGTSLYQTGTSSRNATETVWSKAGSGCSAYEPKPTWQLDTGCNRRSVADVSAVADPNTPVWVRYNNSWYWFGGTSVAAPIIASVYALAGAASSGDLPAKYPYGNVNASALNDVTSGSNGSCSVAYLCNATAGYDGPTGLGTPNNTDAFKAATGPSTSPPTAPQSLAASGQTNQVVLNWQTPSSDGGSAITGYKVYRGTSSNTETLLATPGNVLSYTDTNVTGGTTYYYKVTAVNAKGESSNSNEASATPVSAPTAPRSLAATPGDTNVALTWQTPSSDGGSGITGYKVYRGTSSNSEVPLVTLGNVLGYTDAAVTNGTTYYYKVTAVNSIGESAFSNEVSATPAPTPVVTVPGAPTLTSASTSRGKGINLAWTAPSSDGGAAITGYQIWRGTSSSGEGLYVTVSCSSASCTYKDTATSRGVTYWYKLAAVNSAGPGAFSNEASARAG